MLNGHEQISHESTHSNIGIRRTIYFDGRESRTSNSPDEKLGARDQSRRHILTYKQFDLELDVR